MDAFLLAIAICGVFAVFAVALAWADHSTTAWQRSQRVEHSVVAEPSRKKAA